MKKIIVALVMAFALTGCITVEKPVEAPKSEKTEKVTPKTQEPSTEAPAPDNMDEAFVTLVRGEIPTFERISDADIVKTAKLVCTDIENVTDSDTLAQYMESFYVGTEGELSRYEVGYFIGASIAAYCPDKTYLITGTEGA